MGLCAQSYPSRPIVLIVQNQPAGGGTTGSGTSPQLLMEAVAPAAKVELNRVPFKGNADPMQALLGGHVMAASGATGWDKFVDGGRMRLLVTFGDERTKRWPALPTAKELDDGVLSNPRSGLAGPKGMDPAVVKTLHDAFKKAVDDPARGALLDPLNRSRGYENSARDRQWAADTFARERVLIERLGLLAK